MNVLWITNIPIGNQMGLAGKTGENTSGSWLVSALNCFIDDKRFNLTVVTVGRVNEIKELREGNVTYCLLPGGFPGEYNHLTKKNSTNWEYINRTYTPDIIHVWGTEFTHGYHALKSMPNVPSVVYIQGLLESIARYYLAGMSKKELRDNITFRDIIKLDWITLAQRKYSARSTFEAETIQISKNVIVENRWCSLHCRKIYKNSIIHKCELNIREEFFKARWSRETVEPFTIMSNAAGYPIKGLHILIKALSHVVHRFPDARLLIPGEKSPFKRTFVERIKETGYTKFIRTLIKRLGLEQNVIFLGRLSSEQMAKQMSKANVFVVPSSIENHSSTLIEAMIVGVPCVASYVGGIPEYVTHAENGLLYRFEEYEMLAEHICDLFSDVSYAAKLGNAASSYMRASRSSMDLKDKLISIYRNVIDSNHIKSS